MNIQFDEKNLLADLVGKANGLTRPEIDGQQSKALRALKSFQKKSEQNLYGFPHLPFQAQVVKAINRYAAEVRGSYDSVCLIGIGRSALGPGRSIAGFAGRIRCKGPSPLPIRG